MVFETIIRYVGIPILIAGIFYVFTHFQLLIMNSLLKMDVSHQVRTKINIWVFFSSFILALGLIITNDYMLTN